MATKETITVSFTAKFGPNVNGAWYNVDPKSGLRPDQFEKGKTYDVLVNVSKTGKKYIQQIIGEGSASVKEEVKEPAKEVFKDEVVDTERAKRVSAPKLRDFDAEARGKIACALRAALYASPAVAMYCTSWEEWVKKVDAEVVRGSEEVLKAQRG